MAFTCTTQQSEQRLDVTVTGDIDLAAYPGLQAEAGIWAREGTDVTLDCSQVTFMDSMGLRLMVELKQAINAKGNVFAVTEPSQPVRRVLELTGVQGLFEMAAEE
jgi:anti-sigma B factor antagonist